MALRSLKNHNNSLRYRGLLPKRIFRAADVAGGAVVALAKLPVRPRCAPQTLNHTPLAIMTTVITQQKITPAKNENEPSDCAPTNQPSHGHGTNTARGRRNPPMDPTIFAIAAMANTNEIIDT